MKWIMIRFIYVMIFFSVSTPIAWAGEIKTGVDNTTGQDKIMLHGKLIDIKGQIIQLDDVGPLCRGKRTFYVRSKSTQARLTKGGDIWFWLIGSCGSKNDVIDIITKP